MAKLELITNNSRLSNFGGQKFSRLFPVHGVRLAGLLLVLFVAVGFQLAQSHFINLAVWFPFYLTLLAAFTVNSAFFLFYDELSQSPLITSGLLAFDVVIFSLLIHFTEGNHSFFLLLYLMTVLLAGMTFEKRGALLLAFWTSALWSGLVLLRPELEGQNLYVAVGVNNLAFFGVAFLSGSLSQQLSSLGAELQARKQDVRALRELNQLIAENIATGLIVVDTEGVINHANEASENLMGHKDCDGQSLSSVFPDLNKEIRSSQAPSGVGESHRKEIKYTHPDGDNLIVETILSPLMNASGTQEGYLILMQDLTQIKNMEEKMKQKEKLAAVGQLAAGIAHEIRNPLASISGSIQMMLANVDSEDSENARLMKIVLREIDRLNNLINEFLEYVRPSEESPRKDVIDINRLIQEVMEMVRFNRSVRADVEQDLRLEAKQTILGDYNKLKQAILNIVINSYQAMESTENACVSIETKDREQAVVLVVSDTGEGMDEENRKKIFEPFHTTKNRGTGLGLALTHKILEDHGADVTVDSQPGHGTSFTIEFPGEKDSYQDEALEKVHA